MLCPDVYCQDQARADSLEGLYLKGTYKEREKLNILKELAVNQTNTEKKLDYSNRLIQTAKAKDSVEYLFQGYQEKGNAFRLKSDLGNALESYFLGAKIAVDKKLDQRLGSVYISIADVYSIGKNYKNAAIYYKSGIAILRKVNDSTALASALLNAGDMFVNNEQLDSALLYTKESSVIFEKINSSIGLAYSLGNIGMVFAKKGNDADAEENINRAISILRKYQDYYPICVYLTYMSDIYLAKGDHKKALNYIERSLMLAKKYGLKEQISNANAKLSALYEGLGDYRKSVSYFKEYILYRDSVSNIKAVEQMGDLRTDFEVSKKQIEVDLLHQQKRTQQVIVIATVIALILIFLMAIGLYRRYNFIKRTNRIINEEKRRSDNLLLNILPEETARELKQSGKVLAKKFESVTVLFTDFKGFTHYAENLTPEQLVETVDFYFSRFDEIMGKYNLEKIKTVGDAYMCAGGLPFPTQDHACKMVLAALEIAAFIKDIKQGGNGNEIHFDIRIGINTGPVIAGVVGSKKFAYDIWGDTVNIASRMESNSETGRINISQNTYEFIKEAFDCEYRGQIEVKNKGMMNMYFVNNAKQKA